MSDDLQPTRDLSDHSPGDVLDSQLAAMLAAATGPIDWRSLTAEDAPKAWDELRDWVAWFSAEFAYDHRVVPPCWYRHRALVSVLSALHGHWLCAFDVLNAASGAAEWHVVLLQLEPRLKEWAARTGGAPGAHRDDIDVRYPDDASEWEAHVRADVAARRARDAQLVAEVGTGRG